MIKAAINGIRGHDYHPRLPFNAEQAAIESKESIHAGAQAIHVHVYSVHGVESLHPEDVGAFLLAIRALCPQEPVGISTGAWIVPDLELRLQQISAWNVLPNFVSLNFHENGYEEVGELLLERGIGIEVGLQNSTAAQAFLSWKHHKQCLRILVEPEEATIERAVKTVEAIETALDASGNSLPRLLHGLDATTWPLVRLAAEKKYSTRIGFEDTATLPDGTLASNNALLVEAAVNEMQNGSGHG